MMIARRSGDGIHAEWIHGGGIGVIQNMDDTAYGSLPAQGRR
jgi:hypothetical protein